LNSIDDILFIFLIDHAWFSYALRSFLLFEKKYHRPALSDRNFCCLDVASMFLTLISQFSEVV
jgi:hypothetical protein